MNPYIINAPQTQDQQGLNPVFQNIAAQQQYLSQQLAKSNQLAQPQSHGSSGGMNVAALAEMLRKQNPNTPNNSDMPNPVSPYDSASLNNPAAQTNLYGAN